MIVNNGIKYEDYTLLDGSVKRLVKQVRDGSIIKRFDRTPPPKNPNDVVCPHFLELKWAYGCPFDCAWCYLKGTLRFLPTKTCPRVKDYKRIESHLNAFFDETVNNGYPKEILNSGEIADSLMHENNGKPFSEFILNIFDTQNKHKILFLTKSIWIKKFLKLKTNGSPIISFSLNASYVSGKWEKKAPPIRKRIKAMEQLSEVGYEVRVRIDPMVPIQNWKSHYRDLVDRIFSNFKPERITLGSLRGLQSTINNVKDKSWVKYLSENSNWGKRIDFNTRFSMYFDIISHLKENFDFKDIALCKETVGMWNKLGMDYSKIRCNCVW